MAVEIIIILVLILLNGLLAMAEIAVVSARKARLQQRSEEGDDHARIALELANNPGDFLASVQVGITLVGVLAGAFGGATLAEQLSIRLASYPRLAPYSDAISVGVVVVVITYFTLVLGELVPKRLALNNPEKIAAAVAGPMRIAALVATPFVRLLSASTNFVLRISGIKASNEPPVTEEEIKVMLDQGTQAGVFAEAEQDMVEAVFRLGDRRVGKLLTPRPEVIWLDILAPVEVTHAKILDSVYSRFPVAQGSLDHVLGIVQSKDLLDNLLAGKPLDLMGSIYKPLFVPESMPALKVLELLRKSPVHMALVIDEFGGFQGLVTLFDILESIVGEIPDSGEPSNLEVIQREDGTWLVDGMLPIDEFKEIFRLGELPDESRGYFQTVGGFIMSYLGHIPSVSDHFAWSGLRIEVVDMDGMRVDKVLIALEADAPGNGAKE
jgi:putative hemolysin